MVTQYPTIGLNDDDSFEYLQSNTLDALNLNRTQPRQSLQLIRLDALLIKLLC